MGFVVFATFDHFSEAGWLKSHLESAEIPCALENVHTQSFLPGVAGGIHLMVEESHLEKAQEILEKLNT